MADVLSRTSTSGVSRKGGDGSAPSRTAAPAARTSRRSDHQTDAQRRAAMVAAHAGLARSLARRFANRGESLDDLVQVAMLGLLKAVDRFDPDRGVQFSTYATSTITGEIKRHFRDHRWGLHVTRSVQERYLAVRDATDEQSMTLGRSPTVTEIAQAARVTEEEVLEAQEVGGAFHLASLDQPVGADSPDGIRQIGRADGGMAAVEARVA